MHIPLQNRKFNVYIIKAKKRDSKKFQPLQLQTYGNNQYQQDSGEVNLNTLAQSIVLVVLVKEVR